MHGEITLQLRRRLHVGLGVDDLKTSRNVMKHELVIWADDVPSVITGAELEDHDRVDQLIVTRVASAQARQAVLDGFVR